MSRATDCFPISPAQPLVPAPPPPPPPPNMQSAKDPPAVPAAVAPTEVSYTAYSPTPSSIALHMRGMNRIDQWRQEAPTKRSSTPSPDKVKNLGRSLGDDLVGSRMTFGKAVGVGSAVWSEARPEAGTPNVAEASHDGIERHERRRSDKISEPEPQSTRDIHLRPPGAGDAAAARVKDHRLSSRLNARDASPGRHRVPSRLPSHREQPSPRPSRSRPARSATPAEPSREGIASTRRSSEENRRPSASSPREPKDHQSTSSPVLLANPTHRHLQPLPRPAISPAPSALDGAATGRTNRKQRSGAGTNLQTRFEARLYPLPDSVATGLGSPVSPAVAPPRALPPPSDAMAPPVPPKQPQTPGVPVRQPELVRTPSTRGAAPAGLGSSPPIRQVLERSENALPSVLSAQPLRINHDGLSFDVQPDPRGRVQISIHWPRRGDWRSRKRRERDRVQKLDRDSDEETWPLSTEITNASAAGDTTLSPQPPAGARSRFDRFRDSLLMPRMRREPITRMPQQTLRQLPPSPPPPPPMSPFRPPMRYHSPLPSPVQNSAMPHDAMWHTPAPPPPSPRPGEMPYFEPARPEYGQASQPALAGTVPTWQQARPHPPQTHDPYLSAYPQPFGGHALTHAPPMLAPMPQHYPPQPLQAPPRRPHYTMPPRQMSADHLHPAWRPSLFPSASMRSRIRSPSSLASFDPPSSVGSIGAHHRMRSAPDMLMQQPMDAYPARQRSPSVERWLRESQQQARGPLQNDRQRPRDFFGSAPTGNGMFRRFFASAGRVPGRDGSAPQLQAQNGGDPRSTRRPRPPFKVPTWPNLTRRPAFDRVNPLTGTDANGPGPPRMPQPPRQRTFWGRLFTLPGAGGRAGAGFGLPATARRTRQSGRQAPAGRFPLSAAASAAPQRMRETRDRLKDERRAAKTARRDARAAARMR